MNKEENMERPNRKRVRLPGFDYDTPGYYFITLCTTQKQKLLCDIVGTVREAGPYSDNQTPLTKEKERSFQNALFRMVTRTGIEPMLPP